MQLVPCNYNGDISNNADSNNRLDSPLDVARVIIIIMAGMDPSCNVAATFATTPRTTCVVWIILEYPLTYKSPRQLGLLFDGGVGVLVNYGVAPEEK